MYQLIDITKWCNTCKYEKTSWNKKGTSKQCDKCQFKDSKPSNYIEIKTVNESVEDIKYGR